VEGESQPGPPAQKDPIDLQFAFLDVVPYLTDNERLTLRVGRFGMLFGSGRLVAPPVPVNIDCRRRRGQNCRHTPVPTIQAIELLAKIVPDNLIVGYLTQSGQRTGGGNFWTKEAVASARNFRQIPRYSSQHQQTEGWMALNQTSVFAGVSLAKADVQSRVQNSLSRLLDNSHAARSGSTNPSPPPNT
jgi:hypothetical protein